MIEMSGADAYFLWEESRARHMHTLKILVVDPSSAREKVTFERVCEGALQVLPHLLAFRRRPVRMPLGLGHPLWIDAPVLEASYHLRHELLPVGAGREALDLLIGRIASVPLDHTRPLWQIFFVEGLPGGRIAYVTKLHHAVADGSASAEIVLRSFQGGPEPTALPPVQRSQNEPLPSAAQRIAFGLRASLARQRQLPSLMRRSLRAMQVSREWRRAGRPLPPRPFLAPKTRFNRPITPNRVFAHVTLPLSALREVKSVFGCMLNDVYLAIVGGALRRYLERRGELPGQPLTAAVPVSVRREGDDPAFGNATSYWFASTGSDVAEPLARLRAVADGTLAARELFRARDPRLAVDWLDHWALRRIYQEGLPAVVGALAGRPSYHVIVSNVRGPDHPLYVDGAPLEELYSMGPLTLQQGLNFTAWSYRDDFAVGVHACREHVPDVRELADALRPELEALRDALPGRAGAA